MARLGTRGCSGLVLRPSHDRAIACAGTKPALIVVLPDAIVVRDICAVVGSSRASTGTRQRLRVAVDVVHAV